MLEKRVRKPKQVEDYDSVTKAVSSQVAVAAPIEKVKSTVSQAESKKRDVKEEDKKA